METKGIDLTKCNNCRYKAKVDEVDDYGRICVETGGLVFLRSDKEDGYIASWHCDVQDIIGISGRKVFDFEIVPRDPEIYQDWQVGDKVRDLTEHWDKEAFKEVVFRSGELVVCKDKDGDVAGGYTCGQLHRLGYRLVLTDIEQQIIEEKKKYEPQDGDVVYVKVRHNDIDAIFIFNKNVENRIYGYAGYNIKFDEIVDTHGLAYIPPKIFDDLIEYRPATDEEKQLLFDAMLKQGKRWNAEKKAVEDIPKPYEFRKGEPVLVRAEYGWDWELRAYVELSSIPDATFGKHGVTDGRVTLFYRFCLPYNERTMHLLGTKEDYKEE